MGASWFAAGIPSAANHEATSSATSARSLWAAAVAIAWGVKRRCHPAALGGMVGSMFVGTSGGTGGGVVGAVGTGDMVGTAGIEGIVALVASSRSSLDGGAPRGILWGDGGASTAEATATADVGISGMGGALATGPTGAWKAPHALWKGAAAAWW